MRLRSDTGRWHAVASRSIGIAFVGYLVAASIGVLCVASSTGSDDDDDDDDDEEEGGNDGICVGEDSVRSTAQALLAVFLCLIAPMDVHALRVLLARFLADHSSRVHQITAKASVWGDPLAEGEGNLGDGGDGGDWTDAGEVTGESLATSARTSGSSRLASLGANPAMSSPPLLPKQPETEHSHTEWKASQRSSHHFGSFSALPASRIGDVAGAPRNYRHSDEGFGGYAPPVYQPVPTNNGLNSEGSVDPRQSQELQDSETSAISIRTSMPSGAEPPKGGRGDIDASSSSVEESRIPGGESQAISEEGTPTPPPPPGLLEQQQQQQQQQQQRCFFGVSAPILLHGVLTLLAWVVVAAAATFLRFRDALLVMAYAGGFGASLLAFVLPSACYFKLAPISSDYSAVATCVAFRTVPIVPNQTHMLAVLLVGIAMLAMRAYLAVVCTVGHGGTFSCSFPGSAITSIATCGVIPDGDSTDCD